MNKQHQIHKPNFVPGYGNPNSTIVLVGEAPGATENTQLKPFMGDAERILTNGLSEAGIHRSEIWITNACKFQPPDNDLSKLAEIGIDLVEQVEVLWKEIESINPNIIIACGNLALAALTTSGLTAKELANYTGVMNYRGSILRASRGGYKVLVTIHPAALLYSEEGAVKPWMRSVFARDLKRAKDESYSKLIDIPHRNLIVCTGSQSIQRFTEHFGRNKTVAVCDIETIKSIPACIGFSFDRYSGISIPLFRSLFGTNLTDCGISDLVYCWELIDKIFREFEFVGQNFKFDQLKVEQIGFRIPKFRADNRILAHTINPELPTAHGFLCSVYTREPYYKDEGKEFRLGIDPIKQLFLYNAKDCVTEFEVWEELESLIDELDLRNFYNLIPRHLHELYCAIDKEGIAVDLNIRQHLNDKYQLMWESRQERLNYLCGKSVNVASSPQISELLYKDLKFPARKGGGEEVITSLLANNCDDKPEKAEILDLILSIRQIRKTLSSYVRNKLDYDGRTRTSFNIIGTETGRTSTRILKPPVRREKIGHAFQVITKHGEIGPDVRSMMIVDDGYVFVEGDQSQAEARVVDLLSEDYEGLQEYGKIDKHIKTASIIGLGDYDTLKAKRKKYKEEHDGQDLPERFLGKTCRHAASYDMKKHRAMLTINTDAKKYGFEIKVSEWKAGQFLERFHAANPKIKEVFHKEVQFHLGRNRKLKNPFGRVRQFFGLWNEQLFKEAYAQIPQSTVADKTKLTMLQVKREIPDVRIVMESHDSFTSLVRVNDVRAYVDIVKKHGNSPIDFSECSIPRGELIIPWEFQIGERNLKDMVSYDDN